VSDHSDTHPSQAAPKPGSILERWWLNPMTAERLHAIATILTSEFDLTDPSPLGRAALAEFREWENVDPGREIKIGWENINEIDYRAICWFDGSVP
jgi:uncharacterized cupredoxin-like copper-binding protein